MSCVSILALGSTSAAAHGGGCVELQGPTTINTNKQCVRVERTIAGDVVNNATIGKGNSGNGVGDGNAERKDPGFFIGDEGLIDGRLVNNGTIVGGSAGSGALTLGEDADVTGGILNDGTIASKRGSGISLGTIEYDDDEVEIEAAKLTGDIINAGLISGSDFGIVARYGTMTGSLINQPTGVINGGLAGVYIPDTFTSWTGGIYNSGIIAGGDGGILIGDWGLPTGGYGGEGGESGGEYGGASAAYVLPQGPGVAFSGGIFNNTGGTIVSERGPSIGIAGASFSGGVYNDGLITQNLGEGESYAASVTTSPYYGVGIVFAAPSVEGGLTNGSNGQIYGLAGPAVWITDQTQSFGGGISNAGLISGANDAVRILSGTFSGGLVNAASGQILASSGDGVFATSAWTGGVLNDGLIAGARNGFTYEGTTFAGGFVNNGTITGEESAIVMSGDSFDGGFANSGTVAGLSNGVVLSFGSIAGGFTNAGLISGEFGNGVSIVAGNWGTAEARADIINTASGVISGATTGFALNATNIYGDFLNDGSISGNGENTGVHLTADLFDGNVTNNGDITSAFNALRLDFGTLDGAFANTGTIAGGSNGAILALGTMNGGFTNSGLISGAYGNGVTITATNWGSADARADIVNTTSGVIAGGATGFSLSAMNVYGDFLNDGSISGDAENTGAHLIVDLFDGDVTNNGQIDSAYNALHMEFGTFNGSFSNTGTIAGGVNGAILALGSMSGDFTNFGFIGGESGDGVAITVGSWGSEDDAAVILNAAEGIISGGETGFALSGETIVASVTNDGSISGGVNGAVVEVTNFDAPFANNGTISGGANGLLMLLADANGGFTNAGAITGVSESGVSITATNWGSQAARADIVNTESGVISGGETGFRLNATNVYGDFLNDGSISGDGENTGVHLTADLFDGNFTNNGEIASAHNALRLDFGTFNGAFSNSGTIAGGSNGAILALGSMTGGFTNSGLISGAYGNGVSITATNWGAAEVRADIVNEASGVISGGATGFYFSATSVYADISNAGSIGGGNEGDGIHFAAELFNGSFSNTGAIAAGANGAVFALGAMTGDFTNSGSIGGESGDGVAITVGTWGSEEDVAAILNTIDGIISGGETGFALEGETIVASVTNDGSISGGVNGAVIEVTNFDAPFANNGTISGGTNGLVMLLADAHGGFTNAGAISGLSGNGVSITVTNWGSQAARADIFNTANGTMSGGGTGFELDATNVYGDFKNDGSISGDGENTGVHLAATLFDGDVTNNGTISSVYNALRLDFGTFDGSFSNTGTIAGGSNGAILALGSMIGDFANSGSISGESGDGVSIEVGAWGSEEDTVAILNTIDGEISGGDDGFAFTADTLYATVTNDGVISGGANGAFIEVTNFNASVANNGTISGGTNGLVMVLADASGGFTNTGDITGESGTGVSITATNWGSAEARADFVNTASGTITGGETGFFLSAGNVYGDFKNEGTITGGGSVTGVHLIAELFDGDVINDGLTQAASNALHLEFGTLTGVVRNTDTIEATSVPGTAVLLAIGNGATFENAGLILGDARFTGAAAYAFIGESGGVEGSLIGQSSEGNDDTIAVRGTHYFVGGTASNFASFTVEDGGAALMGARSEGGASAGGYSFANVDQLTVQNGGLLYVDRSAVLEVGSYNQDVGGIVEFFLGAPAGIADLTGDVTAGEGDYGRIIVRGIATLNGTVAGLLDPLFETANADLTSVLYEDVIVAEEGINGDFSAVALIANSSLFEMSSLIDGNTIDVTVARTSLSDISDVPGVIVSLGGPFDAMVSDRSNGVGSSSCGLASAVGGGCFNRFAQNDATQVMTDASPEDPFDWLRTGIRSVGETAVWGRAIGAWGESDGWAGSKGSKFSLAGAIVGADYVFDADLMAGVAAQWTTTDVDFRGRPDSAEVENFEFGAYASLGDTRLYLNANASAIWHNVKVHRFSNGGGRSVGEYDGTTLSAFAEGGKIFESDEGLRIGPFLSLSLTHLETDAYRERGTGPLLFVRDSTLDSLKSTAGVRVGYPIELKSGRKMVPELRLGWTHEFMDTQASFRASVIGQNGAPSVILGEKFARDTVQLGTGVTVPVSDATNLYVDYDAGLNPDITTHTVSVGLRTRW